MPNTNPNRPQSATKPQSASEQWDELAAAMFREYISVPEGESYAEIRHAIEYARRSIMPALTERDALRERVLVLTVALTRAMSLMEADLSDTTGPIMREMAEQARAALRVQS